MATVPAPNPHGVETGPGSRAYGTVLPGPLGWGPAERHPSFLGEPGGARWLAYGGAEGSAALSHCVHCMSLKGHSSPGKPGSDPGGSNSDVDSSNYCVALGGLTYLLQTELLLS